MSGSKLFKIYTIYLILLFLMIQIPNDANSIWSKLIQMIQIPNDPNLAGSFGGYFVSIWFGSLLNPWNPRNWSPKIISQYLSNYLIKSYTGNADWWMVWAYLINSLFFVIHLIWILLKFPDFFHIKTVISLPQIHVPLMHVKLLCFLHGSH